MQMAVSIDDYGRLFQSQQLQITAVYSKPSSQRLRPFTPKLAVSDYGRLPQNKHSVIMAVYPKASGVITAVYPKQALGGYGRLPQTSS